MAQDQTPADQGTRGPIMIDHYRVERELARGAMGVVYLAYEEALDRRVALKFLAPELARDPNIVSRFDREAKAAADLHHPNIVAVFFRGRWRGRPYFAMELIEGESLATRLARGPLPAGEAVGLTLQAAQGLAAAWSRGRVHRDVKPANIMVTKDGTVKLTDFGLAKALDQEGGLTSANIVVGTPHFISPEQAQGHSVDCRSDIYSLGATLYSLLTGRPPFDGPSTMSILVKHIQEPLPPLALHRPDLPPALVALVERMLAKRPEDRPPDYEALTSELDALRAALSSAPGSNPSMVTAPIPRLAPSLAGGAATVAGPLPPADGGDATARMSAVPAAGAGGDTVVSHPAMRRAPARAPERVPAPPPPSKRRRMALAGLCLAVLLGGVAGAAAVRRAKRRAASQLAASPAPSPSPAPSLPPSPPPSPVPTPEADPAALLLGELSLRFPRPVGCLDRLALQTTAWALVRDPSPAPDLKARVVDDPILAKFVKGAENPDEGLAAVDDEHLLSMVARLAAARGTDARALRATVERHRLVEEGILLLRLNNPVRTTFVAALCGVVAGRLKQFDDSMEPWRHDLAARVAREALDKAPAPGPPKLGLRPFREAAQVYDDALLALRMAGMDPRGLEASLAEAAATVPGGTDLAPWKDFDRAAAHAFAALLRLAQEGVGDDGDSLAAIGPVLPPALVLRAAMFRDNTTTARKALGRLVEDLNGRARDLRMSLEPVWGPSLPWVQKFQRLAPDDKDGLRAVASTLPALQAPDLPSGPWDQRLVVVSRLIDKFGDVLRNRATRRFPRLRPGLKPEPPQDQRWGVPPPPPPFPPDEGQPWDDATGMDQNQGPMEGDDW